VAIGKCACQTIRIDEETKVQCGLRRIRMRKGTLVDHSTELKNFSRGRSANQVPLIGWTTSQSIINSVDLVVPRQYFHDGRFANRVPLIGWTIRQPILRLKLS
jgi:hypothetical protein